MRNHHYFLKSVLVGIALMACTLGVTLAESIILPPETAAFEPGTNSALVTQKCTLCHTADYPTTQPPQNRAGWQAVLTKMQNVFGMPPLTANDTTLILDYLVTHYGCSPALISGFWSSTSNAIQPVFIFGKYFKVPHALPPIVRFNGLQSSIVQLITDDILFALVPSGNAVGPITITTDCGIATSPFSFGTVGLGLTVNGTWPSQARINDVVFVFGANFTLGGTQVAMNGVPATLMQVLDANLLFFILPAGSTTGPVHVTVNGVTVSSPTNLVVLP